MTTTTKTQKPASEKQIEWIDKKIAQFKAVPQHAYQVSEIARMLEALREADLIPMTWASAALDALFAMKMPQAEVPEGFHLIDGQVRKVVRSQTGNLYAKVMVPGENGKKGRLEYRPNCLKGLSADTLLTLEKAKAFGLQEGWCCVCGAHLTDPKSVEAGIGPICAKKF